MTTLTAHQQALLFAAFLDADDFGGARPLLAPDCRYESPGDVLIGPEAILDSYRSSSEWGKTALDSVKYESRVVESGNHSATLEFTDHLTWGGLSHTYRCRQHLTFGPEMIVIRIEHEEIPGEREKLNEFFRQCGVNR